MIVFFGLLLSLFVITSLWIGYGVQSVAKTATQEYPGDQVEALIAFVDSEKHNLKERNQAVWALGQLSDQKALPILQKYYTGQPCRHDQFLCQYELKKAIKKCQREVNITTFLWRPIFFRQ